LGGLLSRSGLPNPTSNDAAIVSKTEGIVKKTTGNSRVGPRCCSVNQQTACPGGTEDWAD
jgi:hypothetical protein